ncbi:hypothetical protein MHYP_G00108680 [Metynnis hypsauchen]
MREGAEEEERGSVKGAATRGLSLRGGRSGSAPARENWAAARAFGQRILFTGPDGIGDYRARLSDFTHSIGVGPLSPEATGDLTYLYRAAPHMPAPLPKQCYAGGVGWAVHYGSTLNSTTLLSNKQIKLGECRSALEHRITHRYQNPWPARPCFLDRQQAGARGRLVWNQNIYDNYCQDNNKTFLLSKRRMAQREKDEEAHLSAVTFPTITRVSG